jgi:hypothetical protein
MEQTYVSLMREGPLCEKGWGNREGLCQAMSPKMKTITAPALTASVNSWLRPPADGSIIMAARVPYRLRMPKERQEGGQVRADVWGLVAARFGGRPLLRAGQSRALSRQPSQATMSRRRAGGAILQRAMPGRDWPWRICPCCGGRAVSG